MKIRTKIRILLTTVCFGTFMKIYPQSSIPYAVSIAGSNVSYIASDADTLNKNLYFAGALTGTADFDPTVAKKMVAGVTNIVPTVGIPMGTPVVASYKESVNGVKLNWVQTIAPVSYGSYAYLYNIVYNYSTSSICVMGAFYGKVKAGTSTFISSGGGLNLFILNYSSTGSVIKSATLKSSSIKELQSGNIDEALTDKYGNLYLLGNYTGGHLYFNPVPNNSNSITFPLDMSNTKDYFIAKYDKNLKLKWAKPLRIYWNSISAISISLNKAATKVLLSGSYKVSTSSAIDFNLDEAPFAVSNLNGKAGMYNAFFVEYTTTTCTMGNRRRIEGSPKCTAKYDNSGNVIVVGSKENGKPIYLRPDIDTTLKFITANSAFIAKFNMQGGLLWAKASSMHGNFSVDSKNNTIICGLDPLSKNVKVLKYKSSGVLKWAAAWTSMNTTASTNVSLDKPLSVYGDHIYFMGGFSGKYALTSSAGSKTISGGGFFVAKYKLSGSALSPDAPIEDANAIAYKTFGETNPGLFDATIFPVPATNSLFLELVSESEGVVSIDILNLSGQIVKHFGVENMLSSEINISDLQQGVYLININNGKEFVQKKFIKINE